MIWIGWRAGLPGRRAHEISTVGRVEGWLLARAISLSFRFFLPFPSFSTPTNPHPHPRPMSRTFLVPVDDTDVSVERVSVEGRGESASGKKGGCATRSLTVC
jgi:hypothetical protein